MPLLAEMGIAQEARLIVMERGEPYSILPTSWTRGLELGANSDQNLLSSDF